MDFFTGVMGPDFSDLEPQRDYYLLLLARDEAGRLVRGSAGEAVTLEIPEASANDVVEREFDDTPDMVKMLTDNRAIVLQFQRNGHVELSASWHGVGVDMTFEVGSAPID